MTHPGSSQALGSLPSAFAAACRQARTDVELFERCRDILSQRFNSNAIWFTVHSPSGNIPVLGKADGYANAAEVARCASGSTELVISAAPEVARIMGPVALPVALGLSLVLELRSIMLERQSALDDASFQLRALRQVARLLSSVHSAEETENLVLDFMAEVFFAWWACFYHVTHDAYVLSRFRSLSDQARPGPISRPLLDAALPPGSAVAATDDVGIKSLVPAGAELVVPLDAGGERMAVLVLGPRMNGTPYSRPERELAGTLSFAAAIALKNAQLVERLHNQATTDELTGLFNRRALEERLAAEISRSNRHQIRTTIVLVDVDHFKVINDTLGHAAGDRYLVLVGQLLSKHVRTLDVVGRLGGDEFLVILPMTTTVESRVFINRIQSGVASFAQIHPEFGPTTLSMGLAETPQHGTNTAALLAAADAALYAAKRGGRNAVEVASGLA